ncbi:hypothetical protein VTL71DRAFT_4980 [Oculimacula yallundae]|uniref:Peptidase A1 domain-containing protein n=1 Tax=Oculimacula yallundae TaxID=86028 RepID=A0ABR4C571_9HELO
MGQPLFLLVLTYSLAILCGEASAKKAIGHRFARVSLHDENNDLLKRATAISTLSINATKAAAYFISVQVGTPPQSLQLQLSTGSSDVWILSSDATACAGNKTCITPFEKSASTSISNVTLGDFNISYVDGTNAIGDYIKDTIVFDDMLDDGLILQMALVSETTSSYGIMGIGYPGNEFANTKVFSLWLDADSEFGSILFGGIDRDKYYGTPKSMLVYPDDSEVYREFSVGLKAVTYSGFGVGSLPTTFTNSSFSTPVVLESSTDQMYLPNDLTDAIYESLEVYEHTTYGIAVIDCVFKSLWTLSFTFDSGSLVNVSSNQLIYDMPVTYRPNTRFDTDCGLGIHRTSKGASSSLGDNSLRSAYVVYDLTNNLIAVAQSNLDSKSEDIIEIPPGATTIPEAIGQSMKTSSLRGGSSTSSASSTTSTTSPASASTSKKSHATTVNIGIGLPVAIFVVALIVIGF